MKVAKAHCLFEQSGVFRDAFIRNGISAECYDISNDFGKTDHVVDIFSEIEKAYGGGGSLFDGFSKDDVIMAFFPCTRFEAQISLWFRGECFSQRKWSEEEKPTQYWFIGCSPESNIMVDCQTERRSLYSHCHGGMKEDEEGHSRKILRSMLNPAYANWFVRTYVLTL